ncbi:HmuY family protein [Sphingobacterium faecale]|uniref:HmuY family protein n=1 Tax=Sphingobacterium faecale TaxID=2803775 RepID=A0ABS1QXU6_9SPHI|nr:HmuY family protein [Sphingobacterium faecale]MBL1407252.1 HmuY family protein [Sphingobacterium faecale]
MKTLCIKSKIRPLTILFGTILTLASCGEVYDMNGYDWEPDTPPSDSVFNREIQILNLGDNMPKGHLPLDKEDPLFFSLEKFSSVAIAYRSSERWDLSFSGTARSAIGGNNGKRPGFGHGTSSIGAIAVLEAFYEDITEVPEEHLFQQPGYSGLDDQGEFGTPMGQAVYTFFGNFVRESLGQGAPSPEYWHMVYPLNKRLLESFPKATSMYNDIPLRPRTLVIKTASGNYAKIEIESYYKNSLDPLKMIRHRDTPAGCISFRYIVIKAADKRFGFVERGKKLTVNMTTGRTSVSPTN